MYILISRDRIFLVIIGIFFWGNGLGNLLYYDFMIVWWKKGERWGVVENNGFDVIIEFFYVYLDWYCRVLKLGRILEVFWFIFFILLMKKLR